MGRNIITPLIKEILIGKFKKEGRRLERSRKPFNENTSCIKTQLHPTVDIRGTTSNKFSSQRKMKSLIHFQREETKSYIFFSYNFSRQPTYASESSSTEIGKCLPEKSGPTANQDQVNPVSLLIFPLIHSTRELPSAAYFRNQRRRRISTETRLIFFVSFLFYLVISSFLSRFCELAVRE